MARKGWVTRRLFFFFQAEDGIRDKLVTGVQTCALPISGAQDRGPAGAAARPRTRGGLRHCQRGKRRWRVWGSEERRVGEKGRSRGAPDHLKKKKNSDNLKEAD